jgi:hypothetical protein
MKFSPSLSPLFDQYTPNQSKGWKETKKHKYIPLDEKTIKKIKKKRR